MGEPEERIAFLLKRGNASAAAEALLAGYGGEVRGYLRALLGDAEVAEDAYSAFSENVLKGIATWRREASARSWAYRVAWNAAGRFHRDPWLRRRVRFTTGAVSLLPAQGPSTDGRSRERKLDALAELRASLAPGERALLILKVDRGLPWSEVAAALADQGTALGEQALRKRYERLVRKLARLARARGLLRGS